jgi:hypothetical protein
MRTNIDRNYVHIHRPTYIHTYTQKSLLLLLLFSFVFVCFVLALFRWSFFVRPNSVTGHWLLRSASIFKNNLIT